MYRAAPRAIRTAIGLTLCLVLLPATTATAWTTRPPSEFDTHDWLAHQSVLSAAAHGFAWVDPALCIEGSQLPDVLSGTEYLCDASDSGHADAAGQVADLFDQAVVAYAGGHIDQASSLAGRISHLMADLGDPSFAAGWSVTDARTMWWRNAALGATDAAFKYNGWIDRAQPEYVSDPLRWAEELRASARADAATVSALAAGNAANSLAFRQVLARRLNEIVYRTSSLYATIQASARDDGMSVRRLAGATRYETAVAVSLDAAPEGSAVAILVNGDAWPDAIAATPLCALFDAPILFTSTTSVPEATLAELSRLGADSVKIVGGTGVVSDSVVQTLHARGLSVTRIAGADRYATSDRVAAYARTLDPASVETAYVCTGADFADALSISQVTVRTGSIVLLARPGAAPGDVAVRARALGVREATIVGGSGAVADSTQVALVSALGSSAVRRVQGVDRYQTAAAVLTLRDSLFAEPVSTIALASGTAFPDGLVGGIVTAQEGHGLLLSRTARLSPASASAISDRSETIRGLVLLGGTGVLGDFIAFDVQQALGLGPADLPDQSAYEPTVTVSYSVAEDLHGPTLGLYYVDQSANYRAGRLTRPTDANGVIMVQYHDLPAPVYNPVTVAQHALGAYDEYLLGGSTIARADFLTHANWLRGEGMDARGRFPYKWNYAPRGLTAPWYSAMAQGEGISVLLRAYQLTGDVSYLTAAGRAFAPFTETLATGGVTSVSGSDLWLEEYTEAVPKQVLNGHIFAMWGLWDLYRVTGDTEARALFERAGATLIRHFDDYEYNGYVLYERFPAHYSYSYYWLQIRQLRVLTGITGDLRYADRGDAWALMKSDPSSFGSLSISGLAPVSEGLPPDALE
jgi:putative cell wall-binding protein